ncbi:unnamed protein product [Darwinula stevensoni]|uniref:Uncharacterized protein n=1 Tax=Darwinula stevensoni TaxID=69355 RepID=A0A7R8X5V4_9CRUS|nr:unnamed protein product [Darwinula stevensoni]CAG0886306.1 unnamed protein product [Darwinula stevensoni]
MIKFPHRVRGTATVTTGQHKAARIRLRLQRLQSLRNSIAGFEPPATHSTPSPSQGQEPDGHETTLHPADRMMSERFLSHFLVTSREVQEGGTASHGHFPDGAVEGGMTADGEKLYVARTEHKGDLLPGKLHPSNSVCYVTYAGAEHHKDTYHVLVNPAKSNLDWVAASGGSVPAGALQGGRTAEGEALFIGRCKHQEHLLCGKASREHRFRPRGRWRGREFR